MPRTRQSPSPDDALRRDRSIGSLASEPARTHGREKSEHRPPWSTSVHSPTIAPPQYRGGWSVRPRASIQALQPSTWPRPRGDVHHLMRSQHRGTDRTSVHPQPSRRGRLRSDRGRWRHNRPRSHTPPLSGPAPYNRPRHQAAQRAFHGRLPPTQPSLSSASICPTHYAQPAQRDRRPAQQQRGLKIRGPHQRSGKCRITGVKVRVPCRAANLPHQNTQGLACLCAVNIPGVWGQSPQRVSPANAIPVPISPKSARISIHHHSNGKSL